MSSIPPPVSPLPLSGLSRPTLQQAIDLYLAEAYPSGVLPEPVRRRITWAPEAEVADLLARSPFERVHPPDGSGATVYALRLGNRCYPHMKLQVQAWPSPAGYMLTVNTHDQIVGLDPDSPDVAEFRALQAENQRIKEQIEHAWDDAGLPNFSRYLQDYIKNHPGPTSDAPPAASA